MKYIGLGLYFFYIPIKVMKMPSKTYFIPAVLVIDELSKSILYFRKIWNRQAVLDSVEFSRIFISRNIEKPKMYLNPLENNMTYFEIKIWHHGLPL